MRYVHADDGPRLAVTEVRVPGSSSGAGIPPVLLVHGFAQNRAAFLDGPLPEALLARGPRVFVGELRGHGLSRDANPPSAEDWGLTEHLEQDLPALCRHVLSQTGADRLHYMGHSMGGILGYASLARRPPFASLTGWAAPILLGAGRPLVRLAAKVVPPSMHAVRPGAVPMDAFLRALSAPLARPGLRGPPRWLQRYVGLSNPDAAAPDALARILAGADRESSRVFAEIAQLSGTRRPSLAGIDLIEAIEAFPAPVVAVVGDDDIFAGPQTIQPLARGRHVGLREVLRIPGGAHVDVTMGHHVPSTVHTLWRAING